MSASRKSLEDFLTSAQNFAVGVKKFFFGSLNVDDYDTFSLKSFSRKVSPRSSFKPSNPNVGFNQTETIDCSRNLIVDADNLFRKGPIPIEKLGYKDQSHLSLKACLKEMDDTEKKRTGVKEASDPGSEMLLSYFAR